MAIELNRTSLFTVKYVDKNGNIQLQDIQADGVTGAKDKFAEMNPGVQVVNIWRKM